MQATDDTGHGKRGLRVVVVLIALGGGSAGVSALVWAAAKGAFGKLGEVAIGYLLEHSANPKDLELQRQLALRRQEEAERQAEFERRERSVRSEHERKMAEQRQADAKHQREQERLAHDAHLERLSKLSPRIESRIVQPPIRLQPGECIVVGETMRCNNASPPSNGSDDWVYPVDPPYSEPLR